MAEFGGALDRYLEAPYVDAARREAEFEEFCQATGTDPDADDAWERFEAALDAADAHMEAAIDAAAAQMEREAHEERELPQ